MNFLLYQAYGKPEIAFEALYSILSYLKVSEGLPADEQAQIVVYTDQQALFETYLNQVPKPIRYEPMPAELITEWRGEINFVHRVKIKRLQDFFSRELGNVLYVDTDTVFLSDVSPVFQKIGRGELYMHIQEGTLQSRQNRIFDKIYRFLQPLDFAFRVDGQRIEVPAKTEMWNAGVLGINDRHKNLLQRVLHFTDAVYPQLPMHIIEQLGFSLYFTQNRTVLPAYNYIYHYWNFKEFRGVLGQFFDANKGKTTPELIARLHKIDPQELIKPKLEYENLRGWRRTWRKLSGVKWKLPEYEV